MTIRKNVIGMTAMAVVLLGFASCGHKAKEEAEIKESIEDTLLLQEELEEMETTMEALSEVEAADLGYKTTASGLKYKVIKEGKGISPSATDVVEVNYEGRLTDGTVFDSSYERGVPATFPLNRVIAGWTEGLQLMKEGATYEFYIPYGLAYGEEGGGPIPPKADLIFTVELIKVEK